MRLSALGLALLLTLGTWGCKRTKNPPKARERSTQPQVSPKASKGPKKPVRRDVVLFLGDSLTAGFRLAKEEAFPHLIGQAWKSKAWRTRNAGVSGDTSAGALRRLNWILTPDVHTVFLAIGANDGLRGKKVADLEKNIRQLIEQIQQKNIRVVLAGIKIPPNYGPDYTKAFDAVYAKLATHYKLPLMPFLLKDVAGLPKLNLDDGVHPNAKGHRIIAKNIRAFFTQQGLFVAAPPPAR